MSINKVILIGNIGRNPEVKFGGSTKIVNLSVATTETYKERNGERTSRTEWHNVSVFGKTADFVEEYVTTGMTVFIEGKIRYSKDGDRFFTNINAERVEIVSRKDKADKPQGQEPQEEQTLEPQSADLPF